MARMLLHIQLALFSVVFATVAFSAQKVTVGATDWPPYYYHEGTEEKGLFVDFFAEIEQRSGIDFQIVKYPQKRMLQYFREKKFDIESFVDPAWRCDDCNISYYTVPVMESVNVILMMKDKVFTAESSSDFTGMEIGCNLGYFYTDGFSEAFKTGKIIRSDANSAHSLVQMLKKGHVEAIILDQLVAQYTITKLGFDPDEFKIAYTFTKNSPLALRVNEENVLLIPQLNDAITMMIADGSVDKIVRRAWNIP